MLISDFLFGLNIEKAPDSWIRNYDHAQKTLSDHVMPSEDMIRLFYEQYYLSETQLNQTLSCRKIILEDPKYLLLWHLYYYVLLIVHNCEDEHWRKWPSPKLFSLGEFSIFRMLLMLAHIDALKDTIRFYNLPDTLFEDAIENLIRITSRHYKDEGYYGLSNSNMWWMQFFMRGKIFRTGRLQFEIARYQRNYQIFKNKMGDTEVLSAGNNLKYDNEGLLSETGIFSPEYTEFPRYYCGYGYNQKGYFISEKIKLKRSDWQPALENGDPVLSVHIPSGEKLTPSLVSESMEQALDFAVHYFPDVHFKAFVCHTWLFNTQLSMFLPKNSNIISFQKVFRIMMENVDESCLFNFVFDQPVCALDSLHPKTGFQQKILDHVKAGNNLYAGFGFRMISPEYYKDRC